MKKVLVFFIFISLSNISFSQKKLEKTKAYIAFPLRSHDVNIDLKRYSIEHELEKSKNINLNQEDLLYYNPGNYCEKAGTKLNQDIRISDSKVFSAVRFFFSYAEEITKEVEKDYVAYVLKDKTLLREEIISQTQIKSYTLPQSVIESFFQPFYFKKWEVTNAEYREFINHVRDSLAHHLLSNVNKDGTIKWNKSIDWKNSVLDSLYTKQDRGRGLVVRKIKTHLLSYTYTDGKDNERTLNIYPDTLCWTDSFYYSYNNPKSYSYFSSDSYSEYPVVGINYYQAEAFCAWKTKQLNKVNKKYRLKVKLPNEVEWEWIASDISTDESLEYSVNLLDKSWITDLLLEPSNTSRDITPENELRNLLSNNVFYNGVPKSVSGREYYTYIANPMQRTKSLPKYVIPIEEFNPMIFQNQDNFGVWSMGSNVSEWMSNSYSDWKASFERNQKRLLEIGTQDAKIAYVINAHYDDLCDKNGQLVRGGNWYDKRYSSIDGKNKAGMDLKTFVAPEKAFPTLGFRYVVLFEER